MKSNPLFLNTTAKKIEFSKENSYYSMKWMKKIFIVAHKQIN